MFASSYSTALFVCLLFCGVSGGLDTDEKMRAERLTNLWTHDSTEPVYNECQDLDDGQGLTCGRANFTTAGGDVLYVVEQYTEIKMNNILAKYLPELKRLADSEKAQDAADTSALGSFWFDWGKVSDDDPDFNVQQDQAVDYLFYEPAMALAEDLNLNLPLSKAVLFDTFVQHGDGDDHHPDGVRALVKRTGKAPTNESEEKNWLRSFLVERRKDLLKPYDTALASTWPETVDRVDAYDKMTLDDNWNLRGPIYVNTAQHEAIVV